MKLDFLEIGTADFDLLASHYRYRNGMCVEPVMRYLNAIPRGVNLIKVREAIAEDNQEGTTQVYWIPPEVIDQYKLPIWLRGCNCVGKYHPQHAGLEHLVKIESVTKIPIAKLIEKYNIEKIKAFRIDTEGSDCKILGHFHAILQSRPELCPEEIVFESNELSSSDDVDRTIELYQRLGYQLESRNNENVCLKK